MCKFAPKIEKCFFMGKRSVRRRVFGWALGLCLLLGVLVVGAFWNILLKPNTTVKGEETYIYVRDNDRFEDVLLQLKDSMILKDVHTFKLVSGWLKYEGNVRSGRYRITNGTSNLQLVRKLRAGDQDPLRLRFHQIRTKEQLAGRLSRQIMADSISIIQLLNNSEFLASYQLNPKTVIAIFIPNTYEVYWDMDAKELFYRMKDEFDAFWNDTRRSQAAAIPLTPIEVSTLASIIEEESNQAHEFPIIAGLYINRLRIGMPLQACPTIKFALQDFGLRRILFSHLKVDSPYNTYRHKGLPPGPIRAASIKYLEAVLNYTKHDYLFMTAKETLNGEHNFARTASEHMRNARRYQQALNRLGIR